MKTYGTLALLGTGALLFYALATAGLGLTLGVLAFVLYVLVLASGISILFFLVLGWFQDGLDADRLLVVIPGLPFWSFAKLIYYTAAYWFAVFAITNWEYYGPREEDYHLREADAEFYNKALVLNFRPWCYL